MKVRKISAHITKLESWFMFKMSAWLVQVEDGVYIVDTGMSFMGKQILHEAEKLGKVKAVLLTHGHSDHVGGLQRIVAERNIPVYAHQLELKYMEGQEPFPGRKKSEKLVPPGSVQPLPADENGTLQPIDSLIPYHTPGHSPGHVAYYHKADSVLISGDLFTSSKGKLQQPMKMFTADMRQAVASAVIVSKLKPKLVSIAHSNDVQHAYKQIDHYLQQA
ncbi:putative metallo-hydrolase YybB [Paenibacillus montaniterrae]|uniref:Metallo-hydrolase YybB n=1 Tax=Paenibacillus montaniterrae TaxID=429341 RepID=A0A919YUQ2_9BACL|nr:MBL fold metallo-hydrolase [Paenibacillus montaniterrae]GIP18469.1 putative metallo-hydrolase YybB [Paenibacillus montaniterrae]